MMAVLLHRARSSIERNHLTTQLVRFAGDRSGNVAMMFGLTAIMLFIAIGGALDFGRWAHASVQTKAAMDAAVLRGGRALQTNNEDTAAAIAAAEKFYQENVKTRLKLKSDSVVFDVVDDGTAMTTSGQAWIETTFLKLSTIYR